MEQMINNTNMDMNTGATGATKKQGKGMMIGMICCAVLAAGGIGFGIYEMSQVKTAKQQISDMKVEIKNTDGTTTTLETDKIEVKEADKTVVITDSAKTRENDYFYFDEWGVKVKINSNAKYKIQAYEYDSFAENPGSTQGQYSIWGGMSIVENSDYAYKYNLKVSPNTPALTIQRYVNDLAEYAQIYGKYAEVYKDENYTYFAIRAAGLDFSGGDYSEDAKNELGNAVGDFLDNSGFMDSANYSAI